MPGKRGRPKGYRVGAETKAKISDARRAQELSRVKALPGVPLDVSLEIRQVVTARDGARCVTCLEDGPKLSVTRLDDDPCALERPMAYALLCSFCRDNATLLKMHSYATLRGGGGRTDPD